MTEQELRIFKKENEERAIELVKSLKWYQANKAPNKASVLVEDVLPLVTDFIEKIRLNEIITKE
jgi:ribosomal protein L22